MPTSQTSRILVVDDDEGVRSLVLDVLEQEGFEHSAAENGRKGLDALAAERFDAIISDIDMPGMDGISFLRHVREINLDIPVIILTGSPSLETAIRAVEFGAFRYLTKPVDIDELAKVVTRAANLHRLAEAKRKTVELLGAHEMLLGDRASLEARFSRALAKLTMKYQPIVSWSKKQVFAYECLLRTDEPTIAGPGEFLDAAERLGGVDQLGRHVRTRIAEDAVRLPEHAKLFINLHPRELAGEQLADPEAPLAAIANRVVLEVTERESLPDTAALSRCVEGLRKAGYSIALDDLGAGYAGLTSFTLLEPEYVKLDMFLIQNIHRSSIKRSLVESMVDVCHRLNICVVAEGIEYEEERDTLVDLGCDLFQGYLFARPGSPFPDPEF